MAMEQDYWKQTAGPRWAADQARMDRTLAPYAEALTAAATLPAGTTVVDVGCGCGAATLLAQRLSPGAQVIGLDVSEPMLAVAERRAGEELPGPARPRFVCGDAAAEPLAQGAVERVISRFGVMFFRDPVAAFRHMRSWLTPTGRMVFVVWGAPEENPWLTAPSDVLRDHVVVPEPVPDAPGPMSLGAPARRRAVFEDAGLRIEREDPIDEPMRVFGDLDDVVDFYLGRGPVASALAEASDAVRADAIRALRSYFAGLHDGGGVSLPARAVRVTLAG